MLITSSAVGVKGLNTENLLLRFLIKVTCMSLLFFFLILFFQPKLNSSFSNKFYILSKYLDLLVLVITDLCKDCLY